ncbi:hypothetical protein C8Q79DRAFT_655588 [Trametes meyenii]|nr:hypothetical protein C8Q79DRAFT_655588 [Trametes meyenii]
MLKSPANCQPGFLQHQKVGVSHVLYQYCTTPAADHECECTSSAAAPHERARGDITRRTPTSHAILPAQQNAHRGTCRTQNAAPAATQRACASCVAAAGTYGREDRPRWATGRVLRPRGHGNVGPQARATRLLLCVRVHVHVRVQRRAACAGPERDGMISSHSSRRARSVSTNGKL